MHVYVTGKVLTRLTRVSLVNVQNACLFACQWCRSITYAHIVMGQRRQMAKAAAHMVVLHITEDWRGIQWRADEIFAHRFCAPSIELRVNLIIIR